LTGVKSHFQKLTQETPDRRIFNLLTANRPTILCGAYHCYGVLGYDSYTDQYLVFDPHRELKYLTLGEIKKYGKEIAWIETKGTDLNLKNSHDYLLGTRKNDHLLGKSGNDTLDGWDGDDVLSGGLDDDFLMGSYGNDTLKGGDGDDVLFGDKHQDYLRGGDGDDLLYGDKHQDYLRGDNGNDFLLGGLEDDLLSGGKGRDRFIFNSVKEGIDTIGDFNPSSDFILINRLGFSDQLDKGFLQETQLLKIAKLDDFEGSFSLGFVYATQSGRFAYLDSEQVLHQIAILQNTPELEANNIIVA
jgi:hypothetical protein